MEPNGQIPEHTERLCVCKEEKEEFHFHLQALLQTIVIKVKFPLKQPVLTFSC